MNKEERNMSTFKVAVLEDTKKVVFHDVEKREPGDKIGRASCRERV